MFTPLQDDGGCLVLTAVVDYKQLPVTRAAREIVDQAGDGGVDSRRFVVSRNYD